MLKKILGHRVKKSELEAYRSFVENKADFGQYLEYQKLRTERPSLHTVKQNTIRKFGAKHGYQVLVETGTYLGDMVEAQRDHFERIYSIELGEQLYNDAVKRFERFTHVSILLGDSGVVLKQLIAEIHQPALFWLDGHYSAGVTAKGEKETPILAELETILGAPYEHGILIDDARLFTAQHDYPSIDELAAFITGKAPNRMVAIADDIIRVFPRGE